MTHWFKKIKGEFMVTVILHRCKKKERRKYSMVMEMMHKHPLC